MLENKNLRVKILKNNLKYMKYYTLDLGFNFFNDYISNWSDIKSNFF